MPKGYKLVFTPEQIEEIVRHYEAGESIVTVAQRFGVSYTGMHNAMKKAGVKFRPQARKYTINQHVFDDLNSEAASYWLGFIYADGCVRKTYLQVSLSTKDKEHLCKLSDFLGSNKPVETIHYKSMPRPQVRMVVSGEHLSDRLRKLGIVPRRTNTQAVINQVPDVIFHHWARGFFDGDGCADKRKSICFCGSKDLLLHIRTILANRTGRNPNLSLTRHQSGSVHYLRYKGFHNAHAVADYLYHDATIWLQRKRDVIDSWVDPGTRSERAKRGWITRKANYPPS